MKTWNPHCPYCNKAAELVSGDVVYPHRPDLKDKWFWICKPCDAWVGTHPKDIFHRALGRLANKELRILKMQAHAAFDPIWRGDCIRSERTKSRSEAYKWLAEQMGIKPAKCHIGLFDEERCREAIRICENFTSSQDAQSRIPSKSVKKDLKSIQQEA